MNVVLTSYPGVTSARVHGGFYKSYKGVQSPLMSTIKTQVSRHPSYELHVTGYIREMFLFFRFICYYYIIHSRFSHFKNIITTLVFPLESYIPNIFINYIDIHSEEQRRSSMFWICTKMVLQMSD